MRALVRDAFADGAIGFTSSQLELHVAHDGRGVPRNHAAPDELVALASVLARVRPRRDRVHPAHVPHRLRRRRPRADPRDGPRVGAAGAPQHAHAAAARARRLVSAASSSREAAPPTGSTVHPMFAANRQGAHFALDYDVPVRRDADVPRHAHAARAGSDRERLRDPGAARRRCAPRSPTRAAARSCSSGRWSRVETVHAPEHERYARPRRCRDRASEWGARSARRVPRPLARRRSARRSSCSRAPPNPKRQAATEALDPSTRS